jgi:hypothetical protein
LYGCLICWDGFGEHVRRDCLEGSMRTRIFHPDTQSTAREVSYLYARQMVSPTGEAARDVWDHEV